MPYPTKRNRIVCASGARKLPEATMLHTVARMVLGGGRKVGSTRPRREATSRQSNSPTGTTTPAAIVNACSPRRRMRSAGAAREKVVEQVMPQGKEGG